MGARGGSQGVKLETFFEKFDQFADAPDAVAKMRELILESAIRGMLVPHNASDEPASELLKRMARVQAGQVLKQAALPPVGDDAYLQVPPGWAWTRLGNTGRIFNGDSVSESGKAELAKVEDGLPFIATKDVGYGRAALVYDNGLKVPLRDPRFKVARANAVLICAEGGSAGRKIGITDRDICFGNKLYANEVSAGIHHRYIFYVYQAPTFFREFAARMTGIIGGIARSEFRSLPIPLPPEKEQKRIVAKVDELMALCDRLALQQQERETRHAALARASLARFADAPTPANLSFLFHPSYTIAPADLRKSILTLAVQGKLVPQDPNDEPAESILRATQSLFQRLVAAKKLTSPKPLPPIEDDDVPFSLPSGWAWCRLGQIIRISSGDGLIAKDMNDGPYPVYGGNGVNGYHDEHNVTKRTLVIGRVGFYCGSIHLTPEKAWVTDNAFITTFDEAHLDMDFLSWLLKATDLRERDNATAQPVISGGKVYPTILALPPLAEQRRIVAKVGQLMALVDALEQQLAASRATAANLLSALVAELTGTTAGSKVSAAPAPGTGRRGRPMKSL